MKPETGIFQTVRLDDSLSVFGQVPVALSDRSSDGSRKPGQAMDELEHLRAQVRDLEERLIASQKLEVTGRLSRAVAHDFNNLLMAIQGNAGLIRMMVAPESKAAAKAVKVNEIVAVGTDLVRQFLGFARPFEAAEGPVNLNLMIQETVSLFNRTRKELDIRLNLAKDLCRVNAGRGEMAQMMLNILYNASDAMKTAGTIEIRTENTEINLDMAQTHGVEQGAYVMISVRDQGEGIDESTKEHLFSPFFSTRPPGLATGMGLAFVSRTVAAANGFIVVSTPPEGGCEFGIYLPARRNGQG